MVRPVREILVWQEGSEQACEHMALQSCKQQNSIFLVYDFQCNTAKYIKIHCVVLNSVHTAFSAAGLAPEKMTANLAGIMQACNTSGFLTARSLATTTAGLGSQRWQKLEINTYQ